jgi:hypothetical protein
MVICIRIWEGGMGERTSFQERSEGNLCDWITIDCFLPILYRQFGGLDNHF